MVHHLTLNCSTSAMLRFLPGIEILMPWASGRHVRVTSLSKRQWCMKAWVATECGCWQHSTIASNRSGWSQNARWTAVQLVSMGLLTIRGSLLVRVKYLLDTPRFTDFRSSLILQICAANFFVLHYLPVICLISSTNLNRNREWAQTDIQSFSKSPRPTYTEQLFPEPPPRH